MIVELVGCSGAGKTTLARELRAYGPLAERSVIGSDIVLDHPPFRNVSNTQAANLIQDLAGLPYFLEAAHRDWPFLKMSGHLLRSHAPSRFDEVMNRRSIMRRIGMFELARHHAHGRTVLIDEGPVLIAYHLFVYSTATADGADLDRFCALVPLPDRIVYVKANVPALLQRARARSDPRRQLAGLSTAAMTARIERAVSVFDQVAASPRLRDQVLSVDNTPRDPRARRELVAALGGQLADAARNG